MTEGNTLEKFPPDLQSYGIIISVPQLIKKYNLKLVRDVFFSNDVRSPDSIVLQFMVYLGSRGRKSTFQAAIMFRSEPRTC